MKDYALLKSFSTEIDAEIVKQKLDSLGIKTYTQAEDLSQVLPSLDYTNGVNLYVLPADLERARAAVAMPSEDGSGGLMDDMDTGQ
jgi:hypothetical protein